MSVNFVAQVESFCPLYRNCETRTGFAEIAFYKQIVNILRFSIDKFIFYDIIKNFIVVNLKNMLFQSREFVLD